MYSQTLIVSLKVSLERIDDGHARNLFEVPLILGHDTADAMLQHAGGYQNVRWLRLFGQNLSVLKWRLAVFCLRGSVPCGQVVKVHAIRRPPVKSPMGSRLVIESQVAS